MVDLLILLKNYVGNVLSVMNTSRPQGKCCIYSAGLIRKYILCYQTVCIVPCDWLWSMSVCLWPQSSCQTQNMVRQSNKIIYSDSVFIGLVRRLLLKASQLCIHTLLPPINKIHTAGFPLLQFYQTLITLAPLSAIRNISSTPGLLYISLPAYNDQLKTISWG